MRAAEWLRSRDLPAARLQWESARDIADRLPDDDATIAMRIAPRTMLTSTAFLVGDDAEAEELYRELRELTVPAGDVLSLAIGTAGRIWSLTVNDTRVAEAAALTTELETMVEGLECDAAAMSIILNAVAFGRFANCEFDAALRVADAIRALGPDTPVEEIVSADALAGFVEICLGDVERGRRRLQEATDRARGLASVRYAYILIYWVSAATLGLYQTDDLAEEMPAALRRAESYGDLAGITVVQWAYGAALLRARNGSRDKAIGLLRRASVSVQRTSALTLALSFIQTDLAMDTARSGRRDEAIDELRYLVARHLDRGSRVFVGWPAEALVELLVQRRAPNDLAEVRRIVDNWQSRRPDIPALDLWWLRSRALLARGRGRLGPICASGQDNTSRSVSGSTRGGDSARRTRWWGSDDGDDPGVHVAGSRSPAADECAAVRAEQPWPLDSRANAARMASASRRHWVSLRPRSIHASRRSNSRTGWPPIPSRRCRSVWRRSAGGPSTRSLIWAVRWRPWGRTRF